MKNIYVFVYTEYHLILFINHYLENRFRFKYKLFILAPNLRRFNSTIDLSFLNIEVEEIKSVLSIENDLDGYHIKLIERIKVNKPDIIILFQENNLFSCILVSKLSRIIDFWLFQDGMKPYTKIKSLSILQWKLRITFWLFKNRFFPFIVFNIFRPYSYGNLLGIKKLGLTHPQSYNNWSSCKIEKINFNNISELNLHLNNAFKYDITINFEKQIIFFNQPLINHDINNEFDIINKIRQLNKLDFVYFKLHPLTSDEYRKKCLELNWIYLLDYSVPAELYLLHSQSCIILSIYSTVLLFNVPSNSYYSLSHILLSENKFYKNKFDFSGLPSENINLVRSIEKIVI